MAQLPIRLHQVYYRVKDEKSEAKGSYDQRRDALVAISQDTRPQFTPKLCCPRTSSRRRSSLVMRLNKEGEEPELPKDSAYARLVA